MKRQWLLCWLVASAVSAGEGSGPYLSAGAGVSYYDDDGRLSAIEAQHLPQYRVGAGAYINPYLSVAFDFYYFSAFEGVNDAGGDVEERFKLISADVYAHYPLFEARIDLFAKFGAGQLFWDESGEASRSSSAGALVFGLGVGWRVLKRLCFNLGYDYITFGMDTDASHYNMAMGTGYLEAQVRF